ncbi:hypothetical protein PF005_g6715 [Phytophthora fragariae]|uniref:Myb/SANT-like domain-containing protein n=1 Tax=Phytophthora fragariae TaxID=53985 RepID=A0A6A3ZUK7_9STRA|nr:hypothetical protein PF003_g10040 [Phytophthora fragariae]KAE8942797.1 hypothetical protein PF009_g7458 [Phytophthora fragariae]KAE9020368.1 hypothetical protein PF011_g5446 [Phytophthora fragariae]KAE9100414.1 hypothetical protein PF010_g14827 [Phytophthora fragariae]KAE9123880.1 hypothetical protein PF007_g6913 [Phytophthora fragariae]
MVYRAKENCLVIQEVQGDHGRFSRGEKESKAECWVKITERLAAEPNWKLSPDRLRKHINKLEKAYKMEANADRARTGQEPKKDADDQELERLMKRSVGLKDTKDVEKA